MGLGTWSNINWLYVRVYFELCVPLHWSVCLSLCQSDTVLITVALPFWNRKYESSNVVLLFQCSVGYLESLAIPYEFWDVQNCHWDFDRDCTESVQHYGSCYGLNGIPLKGICWSPNPQDLRTRLYLEIGPFKRGLFSGLPWWSGG